MLESSDLLAFAATTQPPQARAFYEGILGLPCLADEPFALVFNAHGRQLRISKVATLTPAPYTILGWVVSDIAACITALVHQGVTFERYAGVAQDAVGICTFPNGDQVAWFKDPDGNLLSLTQFDQSPT
jgi:catechol 2,3-dioxygenase-like lactoylglutathione lyase family enzyme